MLRIFLVLKQNTIQDYTRGDASSINKHKNLHRADIKEHTRVRTTFTATPKWCIKICQNQEKMKVFEKAGDQKLDIKLNHPQRTSKHIMLSHENE